ncbi:DEAD/DEAH box helicase [Halobacillus litoralis]|uniref:DEAD/DEAH box helicase n=1 Tax=Halobacillus litoralis TaxID=45668 RepID=UPI001CD3EA85|nr:DEAD/DEAH box helicase [Halobacillus litoralis]MCA0972261.1 DEAD/DEAH box helicase [Halobacillus litoralis]
MLYVEKVLSRADEITIQQIIGSQTLKMLRLVDDMYQYNSKLKELVREVEGKEYLLLDPNLRRVIIDLLKQDEIKHLALALDLYDSDSSIPSIYHKIKSKRFSRGSDDEREIFSFFNLTPPPIQQQEESTALTISNGQYPLFKHQRDASKKVKKLLNESPKKTLLHMPTGSGKTRTTMNIIADHLRENEPTVVVWLAASEELCEQAAEEFEKAWGYLGNRPINIHRYWGNKDLEPSDITEGLVVVGFPKITSKVKRSNGHKFIANFANKTSLIIVDEAHQAIATTYRYVLDTLFEHDDNKMLLGLSATPGRTYDDVEEDKRLADFFSKKKVILEVDGYENPVEYLVDEGYIAKVNFKELVYHGDSFQSDDFERFSEIPKDVLDRLGEDEQRNIKVIHETKKLAKNHKRIILFAPSVNSSESISFVLRTMGITSYSLTGSTNPTKRKHVIEDFKDDGEDVKVLCNYGVLTTGFDAPQTSAAIIARPTISLVLYSQMIGRAIRGEKAGGNKEAEILTVIDQGLPGFGSVAEAFVNWEDVWNEY